MKNIIIKELECLAFHDILTGLNNRNYLHRRVNFCDYDFVYFIDINNMHKINESGHIFGDNCIKKCVKNISRLLGKGDLFVRYAGDEFIVLSKTDIDMRSNRMFSVGKTKKSSNDMLKEIEKADRLMLRSKNNRKAKKFI